MNNVIAITTPEMNAYNIANLVAGKLKEKDIKPVVICGFCGAREHYMSNGKTECPNCDEYLD